MLSISQSSSSEQEKTSHAHGSDVIFTRNQQQVAAGSCVSNEDEAHAHHTRLGRQDFDPIAVRRLRMKIDFMIVPTVALLYCFCFIDKANIGNARLAGLEEDLGLKGYDFNIVLSVFYVTYIFFEIPSTILCKVIGPGWYIPTMTVAFGLCSLGTAFVHSMPAICGVRFVLGICECGMFPAVAYYLSRWYTKPELVFRLSIYIASASLSGAFGGLLASGILQVSHFRGLRSWRMIFAIEGILTCSLGLISFVTLTDRPETAIWLSQEEKKLAVARVEADRVATMQLLDDIDKQKLIRGLTCPVAIVTGLIFLFDSLIVNGLAFFLPTIVKTIYPEKSVIFQQIKTVPPYLMGTFFTILVSTLSWRLNRRLIFFIASAPITMVGYILFLATTNPRIRYGATFLTVSGVFQFGALCSAHVAANVDSDTARSAAIGLNVMIGNVGGLLSTWCFLPSDGPNYRIGNGLNLASATMMLLLSCGLLVWMRWDNGRRKRRDPSQALYGLDAKQIENLDWKHPDFRWHT